MRNTQEDFCFISGMMTEKKVTYKDEHGNVLFGFSLKNLNEVVKEQKGIKYLLLLLTILGYVTIILLTFILIQIMRYDLITKFINALRCVS